MWGRSAGWRDRLRGALQRRRRPLELPAELPPGPPAPRPAPPVLVTVSAASPAAPAPLPPPPTTWAEALSAPWGDAWQAAWRGEMLEAPAEPAPPPAPLPPRPRRSKVWLFSVLLAELQAGVLLGAVYEVVRV